MLIQIAKQMHFNSYIFLLMCVFKTLRLKVLQKQFFHLATNFASQKHFFDSLFLNCMFFNLIDGIMQFDFDNRSYF